VGRVLLVLFRGADDREKAWGMCVGVEGTV